MAITMDLGIDAAYRHTAVADYEVREDNVERPEHVTVRCECGEAWESDHPAGTFERGETGADGGDAPYLNRWRDHVYLACWPAVARQAAAGDLVDDWHLFFSAQQRRKIIEQGGDPYPPERIGEVQLLKEQLEDRAEELRDARGELIDTTANLKAERTKREAAEEARDEAREDARLLRIQRNVIAAAAAIVIVVLAIASIPTWAP